MKRYVSVLLTFCILLTLFGCSQKPENTVPETTIRTPETTQTTEDTEPVFSEPINMDGPMTAVSLAAESTTVTAEDGAPIFHYTHQNIALTLSAQATADRVILDFLNRADAVNATADTMIATAESDYANNPTGWIPYFCQSLYDPTRVDRGILSLFGKVVTFTGGFHPEITCASANYDLLTGDVLTLGSILTGEDAIDDLCEMVIAQLNDIAEEKYVRSGFESDIRARFAAEISYDEDWYFSQNGICFYFAPYEIAPYGSGIIVVEIPYSKLVGIIMDEYFPTEQQPLSGTVQAMPFSTDAAAAFTQISELILDKDGAMYLLHTDTSVQDVRVIVEDTMGGTSYTAFACQYLNPADAVVVQYNPDTEDTIYVEYVSRQEVKTLQLTQ